MSGFKSNIKISLTAKKQETPAASLSTTAKSKTHTVASVFNDSDESEPEEMPAEARIRMRNIGKHTPTSAGPNSYGKTNRGFTDRRAEIEKQLREQLERAGDDANQQHLKRKTSNSDGLSDVRKSFAAVINQQKNLDNDQPPSKRSRGSGDDARESLGAKIHAIKDSFTDIVQDIHVEDEDDEQTKQS
ncbi:PEST proteolytic signal-containing nuclear protein-like [Varroa jacobsoni]|uniref:PEST proteolytic signal-containing nuclear protein n=1 Tax=Varroa destructor TaxID=109461 RepID=A0A7M7KPN8_VARDE|nr:PEST proteolytic signal-containing nuclear protein-like [Varroa destructor]XP_022686368.1 PEST proteolytic signal-containing nuclear protein-like [Varroa jacobsoni]